ncbi:PorV/PorQ family protein [Candidatus Margulisiibacteriota bacterium]
MKKSLAILLTLLLFVQQGWGALKITGDSSPADISRVGIGARQLAMGRVSVGTADDAGGWLLNPAGLAGIRAPEVNTMMTKLVGEFNYYFLSYVQPAKQDTFGVSLLHENPGSIPRVDSLDVNGYPVDSGDTIAAGSTLLSVGYGRKWSKNLYLGVAVKHFVQYLDNAHGTSTGADVGLIWGTPIKDLSVGATVVNAAQQGIRWDTTDSTLYNLPTYLRVGLAWEVLNKRLTLAIDDEIGNFNRLNLGAEYWFNKNFALRMGTYGEILTLGVGLRHGFFELDYAYSYEQGPITQTAFVSLTFGNARQSELEQPEIYILEE